MRTMRIRNPLRGRRKLFLNGRRNEMPQTVGRYRILEYIGAGSMGIVYKAVDPGLGRTVAIKTIRFALLSPRPDYKRFITRFYQEARISGTLSHPNIVSVFDMGETEDRIPFLAMEYAEGKTLGKLLDQGDPFRSQSLIALLSQMADGIDYARGKGIIHRDIKPSNIIVDSAGRVKITDFGIAKLMDTQSTQSKGSLLGTPGYMAPEQVLGEPLDARSDIFSLGVVAFEMLSGERPFPGPHIAAVLYRIVHRDPICPLNLERLGFVPEQWHELFSKALAKVPSQRFETAGELVRELAALCPDSNVAESAKAKSRAIASVPAKSIDAPQSNPFDETLTLTPRISIRPFRRGLVLVGAIGLSLTLGLVSLTFLRNRILELPQQSVGIETIPGRRSPWLTSIPASLPETAMGSISIRTDPPGAAVLLNGRDRGVTPLDLEKLGLGAHSLIIEKEAYQLVQLAVLLSAEGPQTALDIPLMPASNPPAPEARSNGTAPNQDRVPQGLVPGQSPHAERVAAVIRQEGRQLLLRNENTYDWLRVTLELGDPRNILSVERIQAGQTYTIINPSTLMPKLITIWCETPAGKGFYSATMS